MGGTLDDSGGLDDSVTIVPGQAGLVLDELDDEPLSVVVLSPQFMATYPLPSSGEVSIGRSTAAEIYVDDPLVSRRHATITMTPTPVITDLGSSNGTRVDGVQLTPALPHSLEIGSVVLVGSAAILVQRGHTSLAARHFWPQLEFEARLKEECARAERGRRTIVLAIVEVVRTAPDMRVRQTLASQLRVSDVVGMCGPSRYGILLDASVAQARIVLERVASELAAQEIQVAWNVASCPEEARTCDDLLAAAAPARPSPVVTSGTTVIGDARMRELYAQVSRIAAGDISVLLTGETGAGKEVMAEEIHRRSARASKPYLRLNCGALSETLLESELFGHERGAFTNAVQSKPGLLETADGGTVLLDEIGEMPMALQVKLLRVLEEKQVRRVGGVKSRPLDIRFLAATNRDLEQQSARGLFRSDLYYRLAGVTLEIPALRARPGDIEPLARMFLAQVTRHLPHPPTLSTDAVAQLLAYNWPGNVRELKHVMERAVLLAGEGMITSAHLPSPRARANPPSQPPDISHPPPPIAIAVTSAEGDDDPERAQILDVLAACGGNQSRAAKQLGMSRGALIRRLERFGVVRPRKPD